MTRPLVVIVELTELEAEAAALALRFTVDPEVDLAHVNEQTRLAVWRSLHKIEDAVERGPWWRASTRRPSRKRG